MNWIYGGPILAFSVILLIAVMRRLRASGRFGVCEFTMVAAAPMCAVAGIGVGRAGLGQGDRTQVWLAFAIVTAVLWVALTASAKLMGRGRKVSG